MSNILRFRSDEFSNPSSIRSDLEKRFAEATGLIPSVAQRRTYADSRWERYGFTSRGDAQHPAITVNSQGFFSSNKQEPTRENIPTFSPTQKP